MDGHKIRESGDTAVQEVDERDWSSHEGVFVGRSESAAARQCAIVLATAAEWHLATLEQMEDRKSTSKSDLARQRKICDQLVAQCVDLRIGVSGLRGEVCSRLRERLKRSQPEAPQNVQKALPSQKIGNDAEEHRKEVVAVWEIAQRLDAFNPEENGAFTGVPSERIERQLRAHQVPGFRGE